MDLERVKTTTISGIIDLFKRNKFKILLAAPTGRAAKRITETTKMPAKTIHRLLEYNPQSGYKKNADNKLKGDVLIIDESSMIDIVMMNTSKGCTCLYDSDYGRRCRPAPIYRSWQCFKGYH